MSDAVKAVEAIRIMQEFDIYPVRVQKGWSVWCTTPNGWPACLFGVVKSSQQFEPARWPGPWSDPATALIETRKWYEKHVLGG